MCVRDGAIDYEIQQLFAKLYAIKSTNEGFNEGAQVVLYHAGKSRVKKEKTEISPAPFVEGLFLFYFFIYVTNKILQREWSLQIYNLRNQMQQKDNQNTSILLLLFMPKLLIIVTLFSIKYPSERLVIFYILFWLFFPKFKVFDYI